MARLLHEEINTTEDMDGNLKQKSTKRVVVHEPEPPYIKLYLNDILYLSDLPTGLSGILYSLLTRMSYAKDGQKIYVNAAMKREILWEQHPQTEKETAEEHKARVESLSLKSIDNALSKFVKGGLLLKEDKGVYIYNPKFFGRGDWLDIKKINLDIKYDPSTSARTFSAVIEKVDKERKEKEELKKKMDKAEQLQESEQIEMSI